MRIAFDAGTIVLTGAPEGIGSVVSPPMAWDDRVQCHRGAACDHRALVEILRSRGLAFDDAVRPGLAAPQPWGVIPLRPYQAAALAAWSAAERQGVVVLPTGAGKTRVALAALAACGARALVLVPTRVLLAQWHDALREFYRGPVGLFGDGARELEPVTVMTYESAHRHMARLGNLFDVLVVDEAHHCGGMLCADVLELCIAPVRLGLTATPPRAPDAIATLARGVGPVVYELMLADLAGGFLAPFRRYAISVRFTAAERRLHDALSQRYRPYVDAFFRLCPGAEWDDLCREAYRQPEGRAALAAWRAARQLVDFHRAKAEMVRVLLERHRDARVLVFTGSNDAAYALARANLIMPITCEIGRAERARCLAAFTDGTLRALVSSQVLNEGLDVPAADIAIIVGGTGTDREHVQRVGRLLRPAAGKQAVVYEIVTAATREVQLAERRGSLLARRSAPGPATQAGLPLLAGGNA